jgi:brefeldin A-inhibited guanine nucleotide-exchange protein
MYAYVDLFEFHGLPLDVALRKFLGQFRIPGEAQKIDALMEKFASKFYSDNSETQLFANAG